MKLFLVWLKKKRNDKSFTVQLFQRVTALYKDSVLGGRQHWKPWNSSLRFLTWIWTDQLNNLCVKQAALAMEEEEEKKKGLWVRLSF